MTRLEASDLLARLDAVVDLFAVTPEVIDELDVYLAWRLEAPLATDNRAFMRAAARERLITALCGEEPTTPLAGNERSDR